MLENHRASGSSMGLSMITIVNITIVSQKLSYLDACYIGTFMLLYPVGFLEISQLLRRIATLFSPFYQLNTQ